MIMTEKRILNMLEWLKVKKKILIGLCTIILIIFIILLVDFSNVIKKILIIGVGGVFVFSIMYTVTFISRALKLKLIFKGIDRKTKFSTSYFSIGIAFIINDLIPTKIGDFAKIGIIKDQENITLNESIGATATERILDIGTLFFISSGTLIYLYIFNSSEIGSNLLFGITLQFYIAIGALLLICIFILLILFLYKSELTLKVIGKISSKLMVYLKNLIVNFRIAMKKFKRHKTELAAILFLEGFIWIIESLIGVFFFHLLGYKLNILILILAQLLKFFSKIFPITPGGWGISENLAAIFILIFYPELPFIEILSIFIVDHILRSAYLLLYGGYSIFHYNFKLKEIESIKIQAKSDNFYSKN